MRALIDMNLPPRLAELMTAYGIESSHWSDIGTHDAEDTEIMTYAQDNDYIVISCDLDFSTIISVMHFTKPSVVQVRLHGLQIEQIALLVTNALKQHEGEIDKGAIVTVDIRKARVRLLPL